MTLIIAGADHAGEWKQTILEKGSFAVVNMVENELECSFLGSVFS